MNSSQCKRLALFYLGPQARVWSRGGTVQVGTESNGIRTIIGEGATFFEAFKDCWPEQAVYTEPTESLGEMANSNPIPENSPGPDANGT